jgi:carbamoyl-phosphate synthase large subunit/carbamoyl-phosphate synthase small subunit
MQKFSLHFEDDGDIIEFKGECFGKNLNKNTLIESELVFTTGMTGLIESITDPSFSNQILIFSYPPFGNYGVPNERYDSWDISMDLESKIVQPIIVICDHQINNYSHWNAKSSIDTFLEKNNVYGIKNVDTRMLIKTARNKKGKVYFRTKAISLNLDTDYISRGIDYFNQTSSLIPQFKNKKTDLSILFVDCGAKASQIRCLVKRGFHLTMVSSRWKNLPNYKDIIKNGYKGLFLSNGPFDPNIWVETLEWLSGILDAEKNVDNKIPVFGICLGHQLLALVNGMKTEKLNPGNRGQNVPVSLLNSPLAYITSQNHGYAVNQESIRENGEWEELCVNLNDGSNEGIIHKTFPYFSVQFHPEARPGPLDTEFFFDIFKSIICEKGKTTLLSKINNKYGTKNFEVKENNKGTVLVLGSGGLSIGQAGEFDYSGSQALKSFTQIGCKTILLNPNIATIQTDVADICYINPIHPETVENILKEHKVDYISISFGGQTALNCAIECDKMGLLEKYNVKVLGTSIDNINKSEDRHLFKNIIKEIGYKVPPSSVVTNVKEAIKIAETHGFPLLVRAGFCLGGQGSGFAHNNDELISFVGKALAISETVILDKSLVGWKELEYEILRDKVGNKICVCTMENMDPLGVHTGESIVVAPTQTLNDREHQQLRDACFKIVDKFEIIGECNVQFALNPNNEDFVIIEMNARLSRSSALASKATGYPIASVAGKLSMGYLLPDITNDITKNTTAFFEPSLDYMAVKVPRWDMLKFPGVNTSIGSHMKSVGEVMAIGRTFPEAIMKASRMVGNFNGILGLYPRKLMKDDKIKVSSTLEPTNRRLLDILDYFWEGKTVDEIEDKTGIDPWFLNQLKYIGESYYGLYKNYNSSVISISTLIPKYELLRLKSIGFSDLQIAKTVNSYEWEIYKLRQRYNIHPCFHKMDTVAAEFPCDTNYLYLTYRSYDNEFAPDNDMILVVGSGVYRIGSSVEFDWCSVKAVQKLREMGKKVIFLNNNPETVSTDYDMVDALVFEEITTEVIDEIKYILNDKFKGAILSVGGQVANNISMELHKRDINILGTHPIMIDMAEDRTKFSKLLDKIGVDQPEWSSFTTLEDAILFCCKVNFPVLVRPSYVLSGVGMMVVNNEEEMNLYLKNSEISSCYPVVITKFIKYAKEIEVDGVAHWGSILAMGISEHVENAGVHSGDATLVFPAMDLTSITRDRIELIVRRITQALSLTGPFNIQLMAKNDKLKVIECNVRVSRSFPLVSKTSGTNLIYLATEIMCKSPNQMEIWEKQRGKLHLDCNRVGVKVPQFSHHRLEGANFILGVEMTSTGEVAGFGNNKYEAFMKALWGTGMMPKIKRKTMLITIFDDKYKNELNDSMIELFKLEWTIEFGYLSPFNEENVICPGNDIIKKIKNKEYEIVINIIQDNGIQSNKKDNIEFGFKCTRTCLDFKVPVITNVKKAKMLLQSLALKINPYVVNSKIDIL